MGVVWSVCGWGGGEARGNLSEPSGGGDVGGSGDGVCVFVWWEEVEGREGSLGGCEERRGGSGGREVVVGVEVDAVGDGCGPSVSSKSPVLKNTGRYEFIHGAF